MIKLYNEIYVQNLAEHCTGRRVLLAEFLMSLPSEQVEQVSCRCHEGTDPTKFTETAFLSEPLKLWQVLGVDEIKLRWSPPLDAATVGTRALGE